MIGKRLVVRLLGFDKFMVALVSKYCRIDVVTHFLWPLVRVVVGRVVSGR